MLDAVGAFCRAGELDLSADRCEQLVAAFLAERQAHVRPVPGAVEMIGRLAEGTRRSIGRRWSGWASRPRVPSVLDVEDRLRVLPPGG